MKTIVKQFSRPAMPAGFVAKALGRQVKIWCLLAAFACVSGGAFAQRTININNPTALRSAGLTEAPLQVLNSAYGAPEQLREFDFNPELQTLSEANRGDVLQLDFFDGRRFRSVIRNVTRYGNGTVGITAR